MIYKFSSCFCFSPLQVFSFPVGKCLSSQSCQQSVQRIQQIRREKDQVKQKHKKNQIHTTLICAAVASSLS